MSSEVPAGLCDRCRNARLIVSDRGSTFVLCELSQTDRRFARYPRLPVLACPGFEPADGSERAGLDAPEPGS